jgi:hypothetical protein
LAHWPVMVGIASAITNDISTCIRGTATFSYTFVFANRHLYFSRYFFVRRHIIVVSPIWCTCVFIRIAHTVASFISGFTHRERYVATIGSF